MGAFLFGFLFGFLVGVVAGICVRAVFDWGMDP